MVNYHQKRVRVNHHYFCCNRERVIPIYSYQVFPVGVEIIFGNKTLFFFQKRPLNRSSDQGKSQGKSDVVSLYVLLIVIFLVASLI